MLSACANKDVHVEGLGSTTHIFADISEANQTNRLATDSPTVCKHSFIPISSFEHIYSFGDAAVNAKNETHGQLGDSISILTWAVRNIDALCRAIVEVDCVVAGASTHDQL